MIAKQSLAVALSRLEGFPYPSVKLEQYPTESELAAELLWQAFMEGLVEGRKVVDLGAGTGVLAIGAALLGAEEVIAVEKDVEAIGALQRNLELYEGCGQVRVVQGDVTDPAKLTGRYDLVIMNPPFGTKQRHADKAFLEAAIRLSDTICTIHKSTTRRFIEAYCAENGFRIAWHADRAFRLRRTMPHHTKERERVEVTLFLLRRTAESETQ